MICYIMLNITYSASGLFGFAFNEVIKMSYNEPTSDLPSVKEITEISVPFYIPSYQRGYRWDKEQVDDLLDDIDSFTSNGEEIYCIQPLIVKKNKRKIYEKDDKEYDVYDVVDGQQRLTTIYLILKCFYEKDSNGVSDEHAKIYSIYYETRKGSHGYLSKTIADMEKEKENNIDYFHIYTVKKEIEDWIKRKYENNDIKRKEFKEKLLNRVCFIWYKIDKNESPKDVFKRINLGKIPLTDAELIKGLFLNSFNYKNLNLPEEIIEEKRNDIAKDWDKIEYALQNDEFWLFVQNDADDDGPNRRPTRIEFILDIIADKNYLELENKEDPNSNKKVSKDSHKTYRYFNSKFFEKRKDPKSNDKWVEDLWSKVRDIYQILDEWYHDPVFYHYAGYLISINNDNNMIRDLIEIWYPKKKSKTIDKNVFKEILKDKIRKHIADKYSNSKYVSWYDKNKHLLLENMLFEEEDVNNGGKRVSKSECKDLLLLHNVETVVRQNEYLKNNKKYNLPNFTKFDFHLYKRENWNVEHIRPDSGDQTEYNGKLLKGHIGFYLHFAEKSTFFSKLKQENIDRIRNFKTKIQNENSTATDEEMAKEFNEINKIIIEYGDGINEENKNR